MLKSINARDYMSESPVTVTSDCNIFKAIELIIEHKISGVTVVDADKNILGIVSELDCLRAILDGSYYGEVGGSVADYMSNNVQSIDPDMAIIDIAKVMLDNNRRRMPISENGKFIGQFSVRSILGAITNLENQEAGFSSQKEKA